MRQRFMWLALGVVTVLAIASQAAAMTFQTPSGMNLSKRVVSLREARYRNVVPQKFDLSCGAAALATIFKYLYGHDEIASEPEIVRDMLLAGDQEKIKTKGFSLLDLKRYAESQNYLAQGYKLPGVDALVKAKVPVITLVDIRGYSHFVVVKGVRRGRAYIADPAFGNRSMSLDELGKVWNGVAFVVLSKSRPARSEFAMEGLLRGPTNEIIRLQELGLRSIFSGSGEF